MAFRELKEGLKTPPGATDRFKTLDAFDRVLDGSVYEDIDRPFDEEEDGGGDYVPLRKRRPSFRYNLSLMVTRRAQAELWGDEQLPAWQCVTDRTGARDKDREKLLEFITTECDLDLVMAEAFAIGQSGSVAIIVRKRDDGIPDFDVIEGKYGAPVFDANNQQRLTMFAHVYDVKGQALIDAMSPSQRAANDNDPPEKKIVADETYWFRIEFDDKKERRFKPLSSGDYERLGQKRTDDSMIEWVVDPKQVYPHKFKCVPVVWIRNMVGRRRNIDGPCTFAPIVDNVIELDYTMSQAGRGLKYNGDPMLFIRRGEMDFTKKRMAGDMAGQAVTDGSGKLAKTGSTVLSEGPGGDAKILEIAGSSIHEQREFAKQIREWSLELIGGNKADAENEKGPSSGKALERLDKPMRLLVKFQRKAYGDLGSVPLMRILLGGLKNGAIKIPDVTPVECDPTMRMRQVWPKEDIADGQDLFMRAQALQILSGNPVAATQFGHPVALIDLEALQQKAANDLGFSDPNSVTSGLDKTQIAQPIAPADTGGKETPPTDGNA